MKKILYLIITSIAFTTSCVNSEKSNLRQLSHEKLIQKLKEGELNLIHLEYRDSLGNEMSPEIKKQMNRGELVREFYVNSKDEIVQVRWKPYRHDRVFQEIQIRELLKNPFKDFVYVDINCEIRDSLLSEAFRIDQAMRSGGEIDEEDSDERNQQIVISTIEKCGWPVDPELIESIWFVIQHANSGYMAYYYPKFKSLVKDSILSASTMALMEDRMLMNNGYPQIYGSQIVRKSVYQMRDAKNVNKIRASVGLGPIEEYTKKFDFEYKPKDYE